MSIQAGGTLPDMHLTMSPRLIHIYVVFDDHRRLSKVSCP